VTKGGSAGCCQLGSLGVETFDVGNRGNGTAREKFGNVVPEAVTGLFNVWDI